MKAFTVSMMFAAAIAMAAPSNADAQPNSRGRHYSPQRGTYGHGYKKARKLRRKIAKLKKQQRTLKARNLRLKRYAKKMHRRGQYRRAMHVRRALRANRKQVQVLQGRINRLQRRLTRHYRRFSSRITLQNIKRRPVVVEVRMGFNQVCSLNPRVAKNMLRRGQKLSVVRRGTVVCYRTLKMRRNARRPFASSWVKRVLPRPGQYKFAVKSPRRFRRGVAYIR